MTFDSTTQTVAGDLPAAATLGDEPVFLELDEVKDAQSPPLAESTDTAAPGWFSRKKAKGESATPNSPAASTAKKPGIAIALRPEDKAGTVWNEPTLLDKLTHLLRGKPAASESETTENPGYQRFRRLLAFAVTGYGISLILHTFITTALALIVIEAADSGQLSLLASNDPDEIVELDEIDTAIDISGRRSGTTGSSADGDREPAEVRFGTAHRAG